MTLKGYVESVKSTHVSGWCYHSELKHPLVVELYVNDIFIRSQRADIERVDIANQNGPQKSGFRFRIGAKLLTYLPPSSTITIQVPEANSALPMLIETSPIIHGQAPDKGETLRAMLDGAYHIDHWGEPKRPFNKNPELKMQMLLLYSQIRGVFNTQGIALYLTGGNLLGVVREFDFLGHDDDIDACFCVNAETPEQAADLFFFYFEDLAPRLIALGYEIGLVNVGQFHIYKRGQVALDVFMSWLTPDGHWYRRTDFGGPIGTNIFATREISLHGVPVLIPQYAERELELTYGQSWRTPDPMFAFRRSKECAEILEKFEAHSAERVAKLKERLKNPREILLTFVDRNF